VKDIGFTGVFRLIFKPLVEELDFRLKVIGGEISSVPGISDALEVCQYINICSR